MFSNVGTVNVEESARGSVGGPPGGPAPGTDPRGLKCSKSPEPLTRRERLLQRSYRSQLENGPIRWARTSESNPLYTSVDASRPRTARRYTGGNGGAAGNRTRVRSAYYRHVYRHSPGEPEQDQYRRSRLAIEGPSGRRCSPGAESCGGCCRFRSAEPVGGSRRDAGSTRVGSCRCGRRSVCRPPLLCGRPARSVCSLPPAWASGVSWPQAERGPHRPGFASPPGSVWRERGLRGSRSRCQLL